MGPPQIFSLARAWVALPAPSLTPALVPCTVMARWCRGHSPICQSSCFRHGLRPVHQLHRMSKGPQRELPHIHSSPLLGAAIPPHHLINTASSYTLVKKPLKRCSIGDRESRGTGGKATSRCTNLSELPKITGPEWCSRAEIDG